MKIYKLNEMVRGWFIGDFSPSVLRTKDFEVGVLKRCKGEKWPKHYHKIATEINCLISGKMTIQGIELAAGDVFVFDPMELADSVFLDDCTIVVIKVPSVIGDKYEI